jgi:hypothetical protein
MDTIRVPDTFRLSSSGFSSSASSRVARTSSMLDDMLVTVVTPAFRNCSSVSITPLPTPATYFSMFAWKSLRALSPIAPKKAK